MGHGVDDLAHSLKDGKWMQKVLIMFDLHALALWMREKIGILDGADLHQLLAALRAKEPTAAWLKAGCTLTIQQVTKLIQFEELVTLIWDDYYKLIASISVLPNHPKKLLTAEFEEICARNRKMAHDGMKVFLS